VTERLYYQDCYLQDFRATVIETADDGRRVYLDRTAFYPTSGGQPFDTGSLGGANVLEVIDEEERVAHVLDAAVSPGEVIGQVNWTRRFDHMQQHSGQHLLSAVLEELFEIPTVSFHLGAELCTIDVTAPAITTVQIDQVEERCAEIVREARPLAISFEDAAADLGLRKESQRKGTLRVIAIQGIDRSACGGTHVRTTAEIGPVLVRKTEKIRGNTRLEFVCGMRALRQARADFRTLQELSRQLSAPASETPALVVAQIEHIKTLEKANQKLASDAAQRDGRELWAATAPDPDGIRRRVEHVVEPGAIDDALRSRAQAFVAQGHAVFLAVSRNPPSVLLAASADSGVHAGERVKSAVTAAGGCGGGNQSLAQGSLPASADMAAVASMLV
jgi:alanyl-tRNA synthetase